MCNVFVSYALCAQYSLEYQNTYPARSTNIIGVMLANLNELFTGFMSSDGQSVTSLPLIYAPVVP